MHFDTWTDYALAWLASSLFIGLLISRMISRGAQEDRRRGKDRRARVRKVSEARNSEQ